MLWAFQSTALLRCIGVARMSADCFESGAHGPDVLLAEPATAAAAGRKTMQERRKCLKQAINLCQQPQYASYMLGDRHSKTDDY